MAMSMYARIGNNFVFIIQQTVENVGLIAWKEHKITSNYSSSSIVNDNNNNFWPKFTIEKALTQQICDRDSESIFSFSFVDEAPLQFETI